MMIFKGRNRIRYNYARFGYTRGGGKTWHGGVDLEGLDDKTIRAAASGRVVFAGIVTSKSNLTWEWGWYVKIATGDGRYWDYYCHCEKLLVKSGQKVNAGDAIAIMGNSGNAKYANPPYAHVHFERRKANGTTGINPCEAAGVLNAVGTYGTAPTPPTSDKRLYITAPTEYFAQQSTVEPLGKLAVDTNYAITHLSAASEAVTVDGKTYTGPWCEFALQNGERYYTLALSDRCTIKTAPKTDKLRALYNLNVRSAPGTAFGKVGLLAKGDSCIISETHNNWGYIAGKGWACLDFIV